MDKQFRLINKNNDPVLWIEIYFIGVEVDSTLIELFNYMEGVADAYVKNPQLIKIFQDKSYSNEEIKQSIRELLIYLEMEEIPE